MKIKGTKKLLLVLTALVCALAFGFATASILSAANPVTAFAAEEETSNTVVLDDAKYFKISNGVLSGLADNIASEIGNKNIKIVIPSGVTAIADQTDEYGLLGQTYAVKLVGLDLGSVTTIGANAFSRNATSGRDALTELTIPASVTSIGNNAFANRTGLTKINFYATACNDFSDKVVENPFYRAGGFSGNSLGVTVTIGSTGNQVTKIPANMFLTNVSTNNNRVTSVKFDNVNIGAGAFGANAFSGCANLETVDFGNSTIEEIGASAFANCSALVGSNKTINGDKVSYDAISLDKVKEIGASAFSGCRSLKSVSFGNGDILKTINNEAFSGCSALANVGLPAGLTHIGDSAFQNCTSFTEITIPQGVKTLGTNSFYGCTGATIINYYAAAAEPTNTNTTTSPFANGANNITLNIGYKSTGGNSDAEVTHLYSYLFRSTTNSQVRVREVNFNNVDIKNSTSPLSLFGNNLFAGCTTLTTVNFADTDNCNIITIGSNAFYGCTSLSNITIPDSVTYIGADAFNGCSALYTINIPSKIDEESDIGNNAFANCSRLIEVYDGTALGIVKDKTDEDKTKFGGVAFYAKNVYTKDDGESKIKIYETSKDYIFYLDGSTNYLIAYTGTSPRLTLPGGSQYGIFSQAFKGNENITSIDATNASLTIIESEAFSGCTSLVEFILSKDDSSLQYINNAAFKGCSALKSITIPSGVKIIGTEAFDGCTSLSTVTFTGRTESGSNVEKFSLENIWAYAFRNCSSLSVIKIPSSVKSIGDSAFAGCTNLKTVYLPAASSFGSKVFNNTYGMFLIAPSRDVYNTYSTNTLYDYKDYLTYKVEIQLTYNCIEHGPHGGTNGYHLEYKLYNRDYNLVEQQDGSWAVGDLFAQHGYTISVWYKNATYTEANKITPEWWNDKWAEKPEIIWVYAQSTARIEIKAKENLVYSEGSTAIPAFSNLADYDVAQGVDTSNYGNIYSVSIVGYAPYYSRSQVTTTIPTTWTAGHYILEVNLNPNAGLGEWSEPFTLPVTVEPMTAIEDFYTHWVKVDNGLGTELDKKGETTTLYIYKQGDKNVPFLEIQKNPDGTDNKNYTTVTVQASYLSYTGNTVTIALKGDTKTFPAGDGKYYTVSGSYTDNSQSESGIYTARVEITANNNYRFSINQAGNAWSNYGVNVKHDAGTNKYTIEKTWYIAVTAMNTPLFNGSPTLAADWKYKELVPNGVYKPMVGNYDKSQNIEVALNDLISFSLIKHADTSRKENTVNGTTQIAQEWTSYSQYDYYINEYMPAGTYTLRLKIKEYIAPDGTTYAGSDQYSYDFTISPGFNNIGTLTSYIETSARAKAYDGEALFFGDVRGLLDVFSISDETLHGSKSDRQANGGYWGRTDNDYLYTGYNIMYDIVAGRIEGTKVQYAASSGKFLTEEDYATKYDGKVQALPRDIGYYRVYYYIYAPSYNCTTTTNFYNVRIYGEVKRSDLPVISSVNYTSRSVVPAVNDKNNWFTVHWLDEKVQDYSYEATKWVGTDSYVFAGTHYLALTINENYTKLKVLEWSDEINTVPNSDNSVLYAKVPFEITPTQNVSTSLTFNNWNWGQYDDKANRPVWSTQYGDYDSYTFTLISKTDSKKVYIYGDNEKGFDKADAGTYTLSAYAAGNTWNNTLVTGYNWYEMTVEIEVTILPGNINWKSAPYVVSWKYGEFTSRTPMTEGILDSSYGNLKDDMEIYYCLVEDIGTQYPSKKKESLTGFVNSDGEVPAGNYALVYSLAETPNYDKWEYPVLFSVVKADNHWAVTPTVTGWYYGDSTIDYETYKPNFSLFVGDKSLVKIEYCLLNENFVEIGGYKSSLKGLMSDGEEHLAVGNYKLKATVDSTENYAGMEFTMNFTVSKAQNSWKDIPSVVSWQEGRWNATDNAFVAADLYGSTVRVTIKDAKDNIIVEKQRLDELNVNVLKKLGVGAYTLIAYVDETYDHEGLESVAYFAVLEDSVGITGLIAATVVFAVIAIGLAAAAAVFLIRRNKKIEEEFRNMVKSELNGR